MKSESTNNFIMNFDDFSDEEILQHIKNGSDFAVEYLIEKYKNFVRLKARTYFLMGADREDIIQEGMIGLYKAIRDYDADRTGNFRSFAEICITRQILTAIKTATRQKHIPLNSYVSLNKPIYEEESERTLMDIIEKDIISDPEELMIHKEDIRSIEKKLPQILSGLEVKVFELYLAGKTYYEISDILFKPVKSIDNALQRIKIKLRKYIEEREKDN